jgi:hypothetical protein
MSPDVKVLFRPAVGGGEPRILEVSEEHWAAAQAAIARGAYVGLNIDGVEVPGTFTVQSDAPSA